MEERIWLGRGCDSGAETLSKLSTQTCTLQSLASGPLPGAAKHLFYYGVLHTAPRPGRLVIRSFFSTALHLPRSTALPGPFSSSFFVLPGKYSTPHPPAASFSDSTITGATCVSAWPSRTPATAKSSIHHTTSHCDYSSYIHTLTSLHQRPPRRYATSTGSWMQLTVSSAGRS